MKLKPYPEYKDSDVEWLGKIPEHWTIPRFRRIASGFSNGTTAQQLASGFSKYPVSRIETISKGKINFEKVGYIKSEDCSPQYWLKKHDFLISHINSYAIVGNSAIYEGRRPLLHGMNLIRVTPSINIDPHFLRFFLLTELFKGQMKRACKPAINQVSVTTTSIKSVIVPYPTIDEQRQIVCFLDAKTRLMDRFIRNKGRLIELLQEQKQAVINDCVTGKMEVRRIVDENGNSSFRLQPSACKMRDSGVDWLGEIPEHWPTVKLKFLFSEIDERSVTGEETLFSLRMFAGLVPHTSVSDRPIKPEDVIGYKITRQGQLVMNRMRAASGLFGITPGLGIVSPDYAVFNVITPVNLNYFLSLFKLPPVQSKFFMESRGIGTGKKGFLRLYSDRFGRIEMSVPPNEEQDRIMKWIRQQTETIDSAITRAQRQIDLIQEYRTRLIADVVTGKVDVRGIPVEDVPKDEALEELVDEVDAGLPDDDGYVEET